MASQLVDTKLFVPSVRGSSVARSRLSRILSRGAEARLTLISAPAGFGKTTLLAAWLAQADRRRAVAWLSLEESDRQPATFWTYVITALQTAVPGVGAGVLPLLQSAPAADRDRPRHGAQRARRRCRTTWTWCSTTTTWSTGPTSRPAWRSCWSTSRRTCTW